MIPHLTVASNQMDSCSSFETAPLSPTTRRRSITFDECVSVQEFDRNSSASSLSSLANTTTTTTTNNNNNNQQQRPRRTKRLSDHPMTVKFMMEGSAGEQTSTTVTPNLTKGDKIQRALDKEISRILLVDPHDIFLKLFSKALKQALPHATIVTAHSSEEALQYYNYSYHQQSFNGFDIILTEERLSLFHRHSSSAAASGSALLQRMSRLEQQQQQDRSSNSTSLLQNRWNKNKKTLFIGMSSHLYQDQDRMLTSGADLCLDKVPTPKIEAHRLEGILRAILIKRERHATLQDVFGIEKDESLLGAKGWKQSSPQ